MLRGPQGPAARPGSGAVRLPSPGVAVRRKRGGPAKGPGEFRPVRISGKSSFGGFGGWTGGALPGEPPPHRGQRWRHGRRACHGRRQRCLTRWQLGRDGGDFLARRDLHRRAGSIPRRFARTGGVHRLDIAGGYLDGALLHVRQDPRPPDGFLILVTPRRPRGGSGAMSGPPHRSGRIREYAVSSRPACARTVLRFRGPAEATVASRSTPIPVLSAAQQGIAPQCPRGTSRGSPPWSRDTGWRRPLFDALSRRCRRRGPVSLWRRGGGLTSGTDRSGRLAAKPFASGFEPVALNWLTLPEWQALQDSDRKAGLDRIRRGNRPPDDFLILLIHFRPAGGHAVRTAPLPAAGRDRTRPSAIRAASAADHAHASWRSCRGASRPAHADQLALWSHAVNLPSICAATPLQTRVRRRQSRALGGSPSARARPCPGPARRSASRSASGLPVRLAVAGRFGIRHESPLTYWIIGITLDPLRVLQRPPPLCPLRRGPLALCSRQGPGGIAAVAEPVGSCPPP